MIRLAMIVDSNVYASKSHFGFKLAEALEKQGVEVMFLDLSETKNFGWEEIKAYQSFKPSYSLSFNSFEPDGKGKFFWDYLKTPHLSLLLDPPIYSYQTFQSELVQFSCIDESHVEWLKDRGHKNTFFLAHGIEPELKTDPVGDRPYDIVFMASCYDPFAARKHPLYSKYQTIIENTVLRFSAQSLSFEEILAEELKSHKIDDLELLELTFIVDTIIRGEERLALLNAIKELPIHLFGGEAWDKSYGASNWKTLLKHKNNIIYHEALSYKESLEVLKKTKISLNTSGFFKRGSHERIFAGLMAGSALYTTYTPWVNHHFEAGKEIMLFDPQHLETIEEDLKALLKDDARRQKMILAGQKKVLEYHTWDNRAQQILAHLKINS